MNNEFVNPLDGQSLPLDSGVSSSDSSAGNTPVEQEKIELEEIPSPTGPQPSQIKSFSGPGAYATKKSFKRPVTGPGHGATRVHTFHTKLADKTLHLLDESINEWIDEHPEVEVKFSTSTVGLVEGKIKNDPHLIVSLWY